MKNYIKLTLIVIAGSIIGCQKDETNQIDMELSTYFDRFEEEALSRGLGVNLELIDISGYISSIDQRGVLGTCTSYSDGSKAVDVEEAYWNNSSDLQKEYLVFHELGHCILEREHDNSKDNSGFCQSIMQSGTGGCRSNYNTGNRKELLDELFTN